MISISTVDFRKSLSDLLNNVAYGNERVVVTRHGREIAALVPVADLRLLEGLRDLANREDVQRLLRDATAADKVSWDRLRSELGL